VSDGESPVREGPSTTHPSPGDLPRFPIDTHPKFWRDEGKIRNLAHWIHYHQPRPTRFHKWKPVAQTLEIPALTLYHRSKVIAPPLFPLKRFEGFTSKHKFVKLHLNKTRVVNTASPRASSGANTWTSPFADRAIQPKPMRFPFIVSQLTPLSFRPPYHGVECLIAVRTPLYCPHPFLLKNTNARINGVPFTRSAGIREILSSRRV